MITTEQAKYLIELPKHIIEGESVLDAKTIMPSEPYQDRYYMISRQDEDFSFFWEVEQSSRKALKLTLHFQEEDASIGLLRVDFNGRHKNPEIANEYVPIEFQPFAGKWLDEYPGHIHFYIESYQPLQWALPLELDTFPVKQLNSFEHMIKAAEAFAGRINLKTTLDFKYQGKVFL